MFKVNNVEAFAAPAVVFEALARNAANVLRFSIDEFENLAYENLKNSLNESDHRAIVNVFIDTSKSLEMHVERPPVEKHGKINKKELMPGRYFEIHGPGGRVKVTTSVSVMEKAKKQGVHVQMKYKMPNGKTPTTFGIYSTKQASSGINTPLSAKKIFNPDGPEYKDILVKINRRIEQMMEEAIGRAS